MKNIGLIGLKNVKNFGDPLLFENTKKLLLREFDDINIIEIDLLGSHNNFFEKIIIFTLRVIIWTHKHLVRKQTELLHFITLLKTNLEQREYFVEKINELDGLIFAGGSLFKYKYEGLDFRVISAVNVSKKLGVPVFFNSVGIEGYDEDNVNFNKLRQAVNSKNVYGISTRDNFPVLEKYYHSNKNIKIYDVIDTALWTDTLFNIDTKSSNNYVVGIGVVRGNIFMDNNIDFTESDLITFYKELILELEKNNIKWEFFTNGQMSDNKFLEKLLLEPFLKNLNYTIKIPKTLDEFIQIVNSYTKLFAIRMHASILGFTLEKPTFGLIWNEKIIHFSKKINHNTRYYDPLNYNIINIVNELNNSNYTDKDYELKITERNKIVLALNDFLKSI